LSGVILSTCGLCDESFKKVSSTSEIVTQARICPDCGLGSVQLCRFDTIKQMSNFRTFVDHWVDSTTDVMSLLQVIVRVLVDLDEFL
jgi:hypothetical protein